MGALTGQNFSPHQSAEVAMQERGMRLQSRRIVLDREFGQMFPTRKYTTASTKQTLIHINAVGHTD